MRRVLPLLLTLVSGVALLVGLGVIPAAHAAPYISCDRPVYNGAVSAKVTCDAASTGKVRLWVRCWSGPVVTATRYTAWVKVAAGTSRSATFTSNGWCSGFLQQWTVSPQIASL